MNTVPALMIVTGTGTDVGKTVATAALAAALAEQGARVAVLKPIQTGEPEGHGDAPTVRRLAGPEITTDTLYRYPEPLAPATAARRAGMDYADLERTAQWVESFTRSHDYVLVEGAGGVLVRLGQQWTIADLALRLAAPAVVVCSTGLGSLNEAELTVEALSRRGVEVLGLIGGSMPKDPDVATRCNVEDLPVVTGCGVWGYILQGAGALSTDEFRALANEVLFFPSA